MTEPASIAEAFDIAKDMRAKGWLMMLSEWKDGTWSCHFNANPLYLSARAETPELAIYRAANAEPHK